MPKDVGGTRHYKLKPEVCRGRGGHSVVQATLTSPFHKGNVYAGTGLDKSFDELNHMLLHSAITVPAACDKTMIQDGVASNQLLA